MQIKAAVVHEKNGPFMMENVDLVEPGADELLVRVVASGICHTDEFGRAQGMPIPLSAAIPRALSSLRSLALPTPSTARKSLTSPPQ